MTHHTDMVVPPARRAAAAGTVAISDPVHAEG
jgi:hypothetical protein